jgi:hypothetical protein
MVLWMSNSPIVFWDIMLCVWRNTMPQSSRWKWQLEWSLITETGSTYQKLFSKSCVHIWQESSSDSIKLRAKYMLKERDSKQPLHNLQFWNQPAFNNSYTQNYNSVSCIFSHTYLNSCEFWGFHRGAFEDVTLLLGTRFLKFVGRNVSNDTRWCRIISLRTWTLISCPSGHIFLLISSSFDMPKFPTAVDIYHTMLPSGMWCWVVHCFILLTYSFNFLTFFPISLFSYTMHIGLSSAPVPVAYSLSTQTISPMWLSLLPYLYLSTELRDITPHKAVTTIFAVTITTH